MAQELIFEWPQAVASGDAFNTTICDSWANLKYAGMLETLKHGMKELLAYHLAGIEASTFTPRPTDSQIAWMEATYTGENVYNLLQENLRSQAGHENDNLDDYILCKMNVSLGYVTSGYSGDGLRISNVGMIKASDLVDSIAYPSTLPSASSETISGYQGNSVTVYQYLLGSNQLVYSNYYTSNFGQPSSSGSWGGGPFNSTLRMTQGMTKTQRGAYWGSNRWSYTSAGYFSALNVESRDIYNPSGTSQSTSGKYPSTEMGGLGTFDDSTDLSDISSKPSLNIFNLGFYSLWNPTAGELQALSAVVWNDPTNWQQWPQIFQSGILKYTDYMPSLGIFPVASSDLTLQNTNFCMGGIVFNGGVASLGTTLTMNQIKEQIIDINLGSISLKEYFGSFLDYAPYSSCSLYLPFFGTVELSMNEIQNADKITILYRINLYDGATVIKVHIEKLNNAAQNGSVDLKHVLYEYNTNVKTEIPITSGANSEHMKTIATIVAAAATTVAAPIAGAGAAALAGAAGSGAAGGSALAMVAKNAPEIGQAVSGAVKTGANVANRAINSMPSGGGIQRGNNGSMAFGLLSERTPFLVINRPIQVLSEHYKEEYGYTASIYTTIGTITDGYIRCDNIDTTNIACNEQEREKIIQILTNEGAYI